MIELNNKTKKDFLNRNWVQGLLDAGVDMSDAKYIIGKDGLSRNDDEPDLTDYVWFKDSAAEIYDTIPTYTVSDLLYKLHKWVVSESGIEQGGIVKTEGPLLNKILSELSDSFCHYAGCQDSTYIKSLALLLMQCYEKERNTSTKGEEE